MSLNFPVSIVFLSLIAMTAGSLVPFQAGSNALLGKALGHPLWATAVSLLISIIVLTPVLFAMNVQTPKISELAAIPFWGWLGGVAGVFFITSSLVLTPKLGATAFIVCVITGQMVISSCIDHFGLMGLPVKEVNIGKLAGIVLIIAGMVVVQMFTSPTIARDVKNNAQIDEKSLSSDGMKSL
ncbi:hypothetical protein BZJ19_16540 [Salinivibrio proteolyticus]|uniref:DMT family transporter n=1 Tax=Salinivibrio proteolyticus TaxID=334715 RepID=UPI000988AEE9|nr:DMT family transporter [Salinivibrio proteolyticus]OOF21287.1 hypothetical protein BZJ19_16540 [Salinivibrio proteolyticus]